MLRDLTERAQGNDPYLHPVAFNERYMCMGPLIHSKYVSNKHSRLS